MGQSKFNQIEDNELLEELMEETKAEGTRMDLVGVCDAMGIHRPRCNSVDSLKEEIC